MIQMWNEAPAATGLRKQPMQNVASTRSPQDKPIWKSLHPMDNSAGTSDYKVCMHLCACACVCVCVCVCVVNAPYGSKVCMCVYVCTRVYMEKPAGTSHYKVCMYVSKHYIIT